MKTPRKWKNPRKPGLTGWLYEVRCGDKSQKYLVSSFDIGLGGALRLSFNAQCACDLAINTWDEAELLATVEDASERTFGRVPP